MSIPVTASTEAFVPDCLKDTEDAPSFTFRHATRMDKHECTLNLSAERIMRHSDDVMRETTIAELKRLFESDNLAHNITRLEAYWSAIDEHTAVLRKHNDAILQLLQDAGEGEKPELPPQPAIEFDEAEALLLDDLVDDVRRHSDRLAKMHSDNLRFNIMWPRMLLRMLLASTTLPVSLTRVAGLITPESCEMVLDRLEQAAAVNGIERGLASSQLLLKATLSMRLDEDEEKNSSSPLSGTTSPEQSASTPSASTSTASKSKSSDPATSDAGNGSSS